MELNAPPEGAFLCRESLLMTSLTEYARTCQPKALAFGRDTDKVRQVRVSCRQ